MEYKTMNFEDIMNWCVANKQEKWLKALISEEITYTNKKGETAVRNPSFMEVKEAFVAKFMPEIKPAKKPHKPTMKELVANL